MHAIHHRAQLACVDEERLAAPVAEAAIPLVACEEPQAHRNLRRVKELARQRHHAVHQVNLDDGLADLMLAGELLNDIAHTFPRLQTQRENTPQETLTVTHRFPPSCSAV